MRISPAVDIWAAGVVMGILLNNNLHPYIDKGESEKQIKEKVARADIDLSKIKCSHLAMDLLKKLLNPNPASRIKASDAILHPWLKPNIEDVLQRDLKSASVGRNSTIYSGMVGSSMTASTQTTLPGGVDPESNAKKNSSLYLRIRERQRSFDPKAQHTMKNVVAKPSEGNKPSANGSDSALRTAFKGLLLMAHVQAQLEGPAAKPISLKLRMISKYKKHPRSPLKAGRVDKVEEASAKLTHAGHGQTYSNILCSPLMTQLTLDPIPAKSKLSSKNCLGNESFDKNQDRWQENSLEVVDIPAEHIGYQKFDLRDCEEELNLEQSTQRHYAISRKNSPSKQHSNTSNQIITTQHGMLIRKNMAPHAIQYGIGNRKESVLSRGPEASANYKLESLQTSLERKYQQLSDNNQNSKLYRVLGKEAGPYAKTWAKTKGLEPSCQSTEASPVLMSRTRGALTEVDRTRSKLKVINMHDPRTSPVLMSTANMSPCDSNRASVDLKQELSGNRVFNTENQLGSRHLEPSSSLSPQIPKTLRPLRRMDAPNSRRDEGIFRLTKEAGTKATTSKQRPQETFKQKLQSLHHSIEDSKRMEDRRKSYLPGQVRGSAYDSPTVRSGMNTSGYSRSQNRQAGLNVSIQAAKNT